MYTGVTSCFREAIGPFAEACSPCLGRVQLGPKREPGDAPCVGCRRHWAAALCPHGTGSRPPESLPCHPAMGAPAESSQGHCLLAAIPGSSSCPGSTSMPGQAHPVTCSTPLQNRPAVVQSLLRAITEQRGLAAWKSPVHEVAVIFPTCC